MRIFQILLVLSNILIYIACNPSSKKEEVQKVSKVGKFNKIALGTCDTTGKGGVTLKVNMWSLPVRILLPPLFMIFLIQK